MKIYSLQEENEKLNASRGIVQPGINHGMFDMKKTSAPVRQQKTPVPSARQRTTSAMQQRRQMTTAPQPHRLPSSPQQKPPQNQKGRFGLLIAWIIVLLFFSFIGCVSKMI